MKKCCQGVWRKITFIPLSALVVGWIVYLVGFCLIITSDEASSSSRFDFIAHYISVATPLIVILLASLHAALSGRPSSIFGLLTAPLSVFCFTAVGYVLYTNAIVLYTYAHHRHDGAELDAKTVVSFIGCLLMSVSWTLVLISWNCFTYKDVTATTDDDYAVDEEGTMDPPPRIPKDPPYFAGVARKLSAVFLVLQLGCWCLFIAGIDIQYSKFSFPEVFFDEVFFTFDVWVVSTIGILLIISAFIHASARGTSSPQMGAFTYILSMLYLLSVGHVIFFLAIVIYHQCVGEDAVDCSITAFPKYQLYELTGAFGTCVFWACVLSLRPFYFKSVESIQDLRIRIRQQRRYLFQRGEEIPLFYQSSGSTPAPSAPPL